MFATHIKVNISQAPHSTTHQERGYQRVKRRYSLDGILDKKKAVSLHSKSESKQHKDNQLANLQHEVLVPNLNISKSPLSPCIRISPRAAGESKAVRINEVTDVKIILPNGELKTSPKGKMSSLEDTDIQKEQNEEQQRDDLLQLINEEQTKPPEDGSKGETKSTNKKDTQRAPTKGRAASLDPLDTTCCAWWY